MIQDLGPKDFDDFYVRLRANGLSPGSIKRYHSVLGGAFQQAMKWGWANRNVVRLATPPSVPRQSRTIPTPTVVAALLHEALESRNPENHVAFRLLAATGARRGEICGLRWSSVDLDRRVLWIRHSVARLRTGKLIEKDPKSHQTREVAIDKNTAQILRDHRERQETLAAMFHTKLDPDGYVIADLERSGCWRGESGCFGDLKVESCCDFAQSGQAGGGVAVGFISLDLLLGDTEFFGQATL